MRSPELMHNGPALGMNAYWAGRTYMTAAGWTVAGELPRDEPKAVLIASPHTSAWDFPFMMAVTGMFRLRLAWMGKHTLFKGAYSHFFKTLGGVPVDRRSPQGLVGQVVDTFAKRDKLYLAVPAAGTRHARPYWKSGFYHIARGANVPIVCTFLDYARKVGGVGPTIYPTGNVRQDMDKIREFYRDIRGLDPSMESRVFLREEAEEEDGKTIITP